MELVGNIVLVVGCVVLLGFLILVKGERGK